MTRSSTTPDMVYQRPGVEVHSTGARLVYHMGSSVDAEVRYEILRKAHMGYHRPRGLARRDSATAQGIRRDTRYQRYL